MTFLSLCETSTGIHLERDELLSSSKAPDLISILVKENCKNAEAVVCQFCLALSMWNEVTNWGREQ